MLCRIGERELNRIIRSQHQGVTGLIVVIAGITPFGEDHLIRAAGGINPVLDRKASRRIQRRRIRDPHELADAIEAEGGTDFAVSEGRAAFSFASAATDEIERMAVARPPSDEASGRIRAVRG